jgi:two-component system sensor histidine kinase BaeS
MSLRGESPTSAAARSAELDAAPARYEMHTAVGVLCSELAHEIAPTLAFLRDLVRSKTLATMDHSIALEEIERLQSVMTSLRRTKLSEDATASVDLAMVAARAADRVHEEARQEARLGPRIVVMVPRGLQVTASERGLELLLVSLLRNAMRAARHAPIELLARPEGDAWCIEVADDGEGLPAELSESLFIPLATLGPLGHGTGVPTIVRIVRDHGWEIAYARSGERTVFTVRVNGSDVTKRSEP